jgi:hypothetical protein
MAGGQNYNGDVKWTAMSTIGAALIAAIAVITVGYWQYSQKSEGISEFRGRIIDAKTGKVVRKAKIVLESEGSPPIIYSDSEGFFFFTLEKGNTQVRIRVEVNGYEKYDRFINPASGSGVEEIQVQPTPSSSESVSTPEASSLSPPSPSASPPLKRTSATSRIGVAIVFDPPSNVRESPNGRILCSVREKTTINIYGSTSSWYYTDVCDNMGVIDSSQITFKPN